MKQVKRPGEDADLSPPNLLVVNESSKGYGEEHHLIPYVQVPSPCGHARPHSFTPATLLHARMHAVPARMLHTGV